MNSGIGVGVVALMLACGTDREDMDDDASGSGVNVTSLDAGADGGLDESSGADGTGGGEAGGDDDGGDGAPKLDVVGGGEGGDDGSAAETCTKVDLLFVIDNSGSMADEQQTLIANFPLFANQIQETLSEVEGYHVGVVTTDDYWNLFASPGINADNPDCRVLGGLVTSTAGGTCGPYAEGARYMTELDDLGSAFACAANVGDTGFGLEKVAGAGIAAITPAMNQAGACNEGFIRDDALLVIVFISDENDDVESVGDPQTWYTSIASAKFNVPDNIVVLSLIWDDGNGNPHGCVQANEEEYGGALAELTNMFTHGSVGNLCADSYEQFFADSIGVIDTACDDFFPPG